MHAGIDEKNLYVRVDLKPPGNAALQLTINIESWNPNANAPSTRLKLEATLAANTLMEWRLADEKSESNGAGTSDPNLAPEVRFAKILELSLPLERLRPRMDGKLRVCVASSSEGLPLDSLPPNGWLELLVASEEKLKELA